MGDFFLSVLDVSKSVKLVERPFDVSVGKVEYGFSKEDNQNDLCKCNRTLHIMLNCISGGEWELAMDANRLNRFANSVLVRCQVIVDKEIYCSLHDTLLTHPYAPSATCPHLSLPLFVSA